MIFSRDRFESVIGSPAKIKVIRELAKGGDLTERRLAEYAGVSNVYAGRLLREFERLHLAHSKRVGKANLWEVNPKSYVYQALKPVLESLNALPSPMDALKEIVRAGSPRGLFDTAILYGSVIQGGEQDASDADLCLVLRPNIPKRDRRVENALEQLSLRCYEAFGKRLSAYLVAAKEWNAKHQSDLLKAIKKGKKVF